MSEWCNEGARHCDLLDRRMSTHKGEALFKTENFFLCGSFVKPTKVGCEIGFLWANKRGERTKDESMKSRERHERNGEEMESRGLGFGGDGKERKSVYLLWL